jgi:hypothetical protein
MHKGVIMKLFIGIVMITISFFLFIITVDNNLIINIILKTLGVLALSFGLMKLIPINEKLY